MPLEEEESEKTPRSKVENQHKLNPLMASSPEIEPRPQWWEASALTTAPSLLATPDKVWLKMMVWTVKKHSVGCLQTKHTRYWARRKDDKFDDDDDDDDDIGNDDDGDDIRHK